MKDAMKEFQPKNLLKCFQNKSKEKEKTSKTYNSLNILELIKASGINFLRSIFYSTKPKKNIYFC